MTSALHTQSALNKFVLFLTLFFNHIFKGLYPEESASKYTLVYF